MPDGLAFHPAALKEWRTLSSGIREPYKKRLAERLIEPRMTTSKLRRSTHRYKIKLLVLVVTVGKRERLAHQRMSSN